MTSQALNLVINLADQASAGLKAFTKNVDNTNKSFEETTRWAQNFTKATIALGVVVGWYALKTFADYEKTMSWVKAVLSPTGEEFKSLGEKVKQLWKDTIYSQSEIAKTTEWLAKNGLDTTQILGWALDAATNFASAAGASLEVSGNVMSDAMNIFWLSAKEASKAVDQMTGVTIASKFDAEDYSLAIAQGGAMAKATGVSFTDFNTTIAATSNAFAWGSDAGTSFKTFIQRLVPASDKAAGAMNDIGFAAYDSQWKMKSMKDIAQNLQNGLKGMSDEQKNATLTTIFGSDAMRMAATIAEQWAAGFDKFSQSIAKVSAADQAKIRLDNFSWSLESLKGTLDLLATNLGEKIAGVLRPAIDALNKSLGDMTGWWESLSPGMQEFLSVIGTAAIVIGGVTLAIGALGIAFSLAAPAVTAVAGALAFLISPIGLVIAAVTALGLAYTTNFLGIKDATDTVVLALKPILESLILTFSNVATQILQYINLIKWPLMTVWNEISPFIIEFLQIISALFKSTFDNLIIVLQWAWNIIKWIFEVAFNLIAGVTTLFFQTLTGDWSGAWETIKTMTSGVFDGLKLITQGLFQILEGLFKEFWTLAIALFEWMWTWIKTVTSAATSLLTTLIEWFWNGIKNINQIIIDAIITISSSLWTGLTSIFTAGQALITGGWTSFANNLGTIITNVWNGIKATIAQWINWIINKVNSVINSINSAASATGINIPTIPVVAFQKWGIVPGFWSKFQTGWIVPGWVNPAHHDQVSTMLDPGELILNRAQQSNLANQIQSTNNTPSLIPTIPTINLSINMGWITVNNEADENRMIDNMKKSLIRELQLYSRFGIS